MADDMWDHFIDGVFIIIAVAVVSVLSYGAYLGIRDYIWPHRVITVKIIGVCVVFVVASIALGWFKNKGWSEIKKGLGEWRRAL